MLSNGSDVIRNGDTWIKPSALSQMSDANEMHRAQGGTWPVWVVSVSAAGVKGRARIGEKAAERRKRGYTRRAIGEKQRDKIYGSHRASAVFVPRKEEDGDEREQIATPKSERR